MSLGSFITLWLSPRGIVAAVRRRGPPKVRVWVSLGSFCVSIDGPKDHGLANMICREGWKTHVSGGNEVSRMCQMSPRLKKEVVQELRVEDKVVETTSPAH